MSNINEKTTVPVTWAATICIALAGICLWLGAMQIQISVLSSANLITRLTVLESQYQGMLADIRNISGKVNDINENIAGIKSDLKYLVKDKK